MEQGCTLSALRFLGTGHVRHSHKISRALQALLVLLGAATSSRSFKHQAFSLSQAREAERI